MSFRGKILRSDDNEVRFRSPISCDGNLLKGCEVCWTCFFFDVATNECWMATDRSRECIRYPDWHRCAYWKEKLEE